VAGARDHAQIEIALPRRQHAPAFFETAAREGVTLAPDAGDARADRGQRLPQHIGLRDRPRLEARPPEVLDLQRHRQVIGALRVTQHQAAQVLPVHAPDLLGGHRRFDPQQGARRRGPEPQAARPQHHQRPEAPPEPRGHEAPDDPAEREPRQVERGGGRQHDVERGGHEVGQAVGRMRLGRRVRVAEPRHVGHEDAEARRERDDVPDPVRPGAARPVEQDQRGPCAPAPPHDGAVPRERYRPRCQGSDP
jgi:hypothetical protein